MCLYVHYMYISYKYRNIYATRVYWKTGKRERARVRGHGVGRWRRRRRNGTCVVVMVERIQM